MVERGFSAPCLVPSVANILGVSEVMRVAKGEVRAWSWKGMQTL